MNRFNTIPVKIPMMYFLGLEQILQKFIYYESSHIATVILRKNKFGGITLSNIKLYHKAIVIKTAWHWHKNTHRSMEQNREARNKPIPL